MVLCMYYEWQNQAGVKRNCLLPPHLSCGLAQLISPLKKQHREKICSWIFPFNMGFGLRRSKGKVGRKISLGQR